MCPWYEELEAVLRDHPMARPMSFQDFSLELDNPLDPLDPDSRAPSHDPNLNNRPDMDAYAPWNPTPTPNITNHESETQATLDPLLKD